MPWSTWIRYILAVEQSLFITVSLINGHYQQSFSITFSQKRLHCKHLWENWTATISDISSLPGISLFSVLNWVVSPHSKLPFLLQNYSHHQCCQQTEDFLLIMCVKETSILNSTCSVPFSAFKWKVLWFFLFVLLIFQQKTCSHFHLTTTSIKLFYLLMLLSNKGGILQKHSSLLSLCSF